MELMTIIMIIVFAVLGFLAGRLTAPAKSTPSGKQPTSGYRENKNTDIK